jgi:SAM-dependent methyltransferase
LIVPHMTASYYNQLAPFYRYLFQDWDRSVSWHAQVLDGVIRVHFGPGVRTILDAACGIGTQSLGLAQLGYRVSGSDISVAAIEQARAEAARRGLLLDFSVADMRQLSHAHPGTFDVVIACDNAIPHLLNEAEILLAFRQFYACSTPQGGCVLSVRDYASMQLGGRQFYPRLVHPTSQGRMVLFDIWEFDGDYYDFTTYIVEDRGGTGLETHAIRGGRYYCVSIATLERLLLAAGFARVVLIREGYHQPILVGLKGETPSRSPAQADDQVLVYPGA